MEEITIRTEAMPCMAQDRDEAIYFATAYGDIEPPNTARAIADTMGFPSKITTYHNELLITIQIGGRDKRQVESLITAIKLAVPELHEATIERETKPDY